MGAQLTFDQIHHRVSGDPTKPWLIFLHGLLGFGANWRRVTPYFEPHFHVVVFDQRGHGKTAQAQDPRATYSYRPEDFAEDLAILMEGLKISKAHIVGHSMGGRNALCFATTYAEKVDKLVIEDIGPEPDIESITRIERLLGSVPVPFLTKLAAKEFFLNQFEDPKLGQYLYANLIAGLDGSLKWQFDPKVMIEIVREGRSQSRWNEWYALQCQTLVLRGEASLDLTKIIYNEMLASSRVARGVEIFESGHWIHAEKPLEFSQAVLSFLDGKEK